METQPLLLTSLTPRERTSGRLHAYEAARCHPICTVRPVVLACRRTLGPTLGWN